MSSKTDIANLVAIRIGEAIVDDIAADNVAFTNEFNAVWSPIVEETLGIGPEKGWKFTQWDVSEVDRDSATITAFTLATATTTTVTATHALLAGDQVIITGTTNYDGQYLVESISTTVSFVITATFVADDATGTAKWTSDKFAYRYAKPTSTRVTDVCVGGLPITDWIVKRTWVLTNMESDTVAMSYILALSDLAVTDFPTYFIQVLWRKMAIHVLYTRTQNKGLQDRLTEEIEEVYLPRAMATDAKEQYVQEESDAWTAAGHTTTLID
ncbi:MAG TPA: hypothetical protein ENI05_04010 [Porticoccus sp.]|nr:hypothetical protein [Porticoccus sp.]